MTHAESQELLVDLAYGELDAERAALVKSHMEACAECREEKAALDEARRLAAPLRELEEPSAGFDDRILEAARAQASLEHDGNLGQVIDVAGTVRPLGVEAARIDAHGPVKTRPAERRRPRWVMRAAVGGSVAAAAALAMVVGNTLEMRRNAERAAAARGEDYAIRVGPPTASSVDAALRDAEGKRTEAVAQAPKSEPAASEPKAQPAAPPAAVPMPSEKKTAERRTLRKSERAFGEGSGGDAPPKVASKEAPAPQRAQADQLSRNVPAATAPEEERTAGAVSSMDAQTRRRADAPEAAPAKAGRLAVATPAITASGYESSAQQARHAGNYVLAADLYRRAAEARQRDKDAATAAWNLAHAVECLSAAGRFEEARQVRDELARTYPTEATALSAARRALREVEPAPAVR
jgi:Putative zinc-finger